MSDNPYLPADVEAVLADQIDDLRPRLRENVRWYAALEVARDNPALSAELRENIRLAMESAEYTINRLSLERYWAAEEKRQLESDLAASQPPIVAAAYALAKHRMGPNHWKHTVENHLINAVVDAVKGGESP